MSNITHFYKSIFFGVVAVAFLLLTVSFFLPLTVHAAPQQLHGWAWSSNIGWIGFNCADVSACATANYKVTFDDVSGDLSGYAWSSSIGWVWFDIAAAGCPNGTCPPKVNMSGGVDKQVTGWARACSVFANTNSCAGGLKSNAARGGWDGWIELSGTNHISPNATGAGGVTYRVGLSKFVGFAWGGDVIGWLNFDQIAITPPSTFTLTVNSIGASGVSIVGSSAIYGGITNYSRTGILSGTSLSLTALPPVGGNTFSGWSGCNNFSGTTCNVTMDATKLVTVNYVATPPPTPASLTATPLCPAPGNAGVALSWTNVSGETSYEIQRAIDSTFTIDLTTFTRSADTTTYTDTSPNISTSYYYRIRAVNGVGSSAWRNAISFPVTTGSCPVGSGSFTLSATPSTITVDASSFFYSFSKLSEIRVTSPDGYNRNIQLSLVSVTPSTPVGFLDVYTPDSIIGFAEYGGGTSFQARVETSAADPNVDKTFFVTLRGTGVGGPLTFDDVTLTLVVKASDPGGGEQ